MTQGFSLLEVLIVMLVICILTALSFSYLPAHERLLKPDEQVVRIIDVLQEARQRSLTQRETIRVEIDVTENIIKLIDENQSTTADDDRRIREIPLLPSNEVKINSRPPDISTNPQEALDVPAAKFNPSSYPTSAAHNVCTIRFLRNGTVVNEGDDSIGTNAQVTGITLFNWSPKKNNANQTEIARAITIIGATGSVRAWEYNSALTAANKWQNSRRVTAP